MTQLRSLTSSLCVLLLVAPVLAPAQSGVMVKEPAGSGFFTIVDDVSFAICRIDVLIDQLNSLIGEVL